MREDSLYVPSPSPHLALAAALLTLLTLRRRENREHHAPQLGEGAIAYTGRVINANAEGGNYALEWDTLLYSIDYWAVVEGSPNKEEAMKLIDFITNADELRKQAAIWPISPANKEVNEDPAIQEANPGMVLNHSDEGLFISTEFWIEHGDELEARFTAWAAQ